MRCSVFWKRIISFTLTFVFGLFIVNVLQKEISVNRIQESVKPVEKIVHQEGNDISSGDKTSVINKTINKTQENIRPDLQGLKIISKPRANYTDAARQNQIQGTVTLRVTFLESGHIGSVSPISGLPDGLTEQAMAAAAQIRFEPANKNGEPITVTKSVQYSFTIY
jgi:TonB family protein